MKRHLKLGVTITPIGIIAKVLEQTKKDSEFAGTGNVFNASNGIKLISAGNPKCMGADVYVLDIGFANIVFEIPNQKTLSRIIEAVNEYNRFYGEEEEVKPIQDIKYFEVG